MVYFLIGLLVGANTTFIVMCVIAAGHDDRGGKK